jgi:hypothetical protein
MAGYSMKDFDTRGNAVLNSLCNQALDAQGDTLNRAVILRSVELLVRGVSAIKQAMDGVGDWAANSG